jgi:hypothetical protein
MPFDDSVAIYIPKEYFFQLSEVIRVGLQEAKISREARENLTGWWDAESELAQDDMTQPRKTND